MSDNFLAVFQTELICGTFWENEFCTDYRPSPWCTIKKVNIV